MQARMVFIIDSYPGPLGRGIECGPGSPLDAPSAGPVIVGGARPGRPPTTQETTRMTRYGSDPRRIARALARVCVTLLVGVGPALAADDAKPAAVAADHSSTMARGLDLFKGG